MPVPWKRPSVKTRYALFWQSNYSKKCLGNFKTPIVCRNSSCPTEFTSLTLVKNGALTVSCLVTMQTKGVTRAVNKACAATAVAFTLNRNTQMANFKVRTAAKYRNLLSRRSGIKQTRNNCVADNTSDKLKDDFNVLLTTVFVSGLLEET